MAQASVNVSADIIPDTRKLERQSAEAVARGTQSGVRQGFNGLNLDKTNKGFGALTNGVRTFDRELDRANRRLLSFAAAGTVVYGTVRAFNALVASTVQVEKSLTAINSIFKLSMRELDVFGKGLFNIARETSQSFADVAKAAEEFSRQGLTAAETAKRTRDALLLVRLTGLDVTKAVQGLTAAMNTFGKTGIDTTRIVNQLVAADDAFAVSAGGIIEAFARVGSVVDDSGTKLEEFIGLVTALRQVTGRSEATIGNSLKTILTRLERSSTLDQLRALGIAVDDAAGSAKSAFEIFKLLGQSYDGLNKEQQQYVSELAAGVFQINQFKAAVSELGKTNGLVAQASAVAANATNEALIRNATLNNSLDSSIQRLKASAQQAASVVGELAVKPALNDLLKSGQAFTSLFEGINTQGTTRAAEDFGAYVAESFLKGIGNVLAGPGILLAFKAIAGVGFRVATDSLRDYKDFSSTTSRVTGQKVRQLFGMGGGARGEETSLKTVNNLLNQATTAEQRRFQAARSVAEQEMIILSILERQAAAQAKMAGRSAGVAWAGRPRAAEGYIPMAEEGDAIRRGVGGAPASARPVYLPGFNRGGGQRGIVANTSEWIVPGAAGGAIFNREMIQQFGLPPGSKPVAAGGFIPNAAGGSLKSAMEIALGKSPNAPFSSYEAAVRRMAKSEQQIISGGTADINAMMRGMGGVLPYGPQMTPDFAAKLEKLQAADQARKNRDFERAKKELEAKEKVESESAAVKRDQLAEMNAVLDKEEALRKRKAQLSASDIKAGEKYLGALQKLYTEARERGDPIVRQLAAQKSAATAPIITGARSVFEIRGIPDAPYEFDNRGIVSTNPALMGAGAAPQRTRIPSYTGSREDVERIKQVYRQQVVEEKQAQRQKEIIETNRRQEVLRARLQAEAARVQQAKLVEAEMDQQRRAIRRQQNLERRSTNVLMGSTALSFGAAFLPEGRGGTAFGQSMAASSGGMQGAAIGASMGSFFGPKGILGGAILGGLVGAVNGFVKKATVSFEELAKDIEENNSAAMRRMDAVQGVLENQRNIGQAIREGRGPDMINALMKQQGSLMAGVDSGTLQRIVAAGLNEEAQLSLISQLKGEDIERRTMQGVAPGIVSLSGKGGTPQRFTEVASTLRSHLNEGVNFSSLAAKTKKGIRDTKTDLLDFGKSFISSDIGGLFTILSRTGAAARDDVEKEFLDILSKSKLDESEKKKAAEAIKTLKNEELGQLIQSLAAGGSSERAVGIGARAALAMGNVERLTSGRMRELDQAIRLGSVEASGRNRLTSMREQAALGLGGLSEGGVQGLTSQFRLNEATRTVSSSNTLALMKAQFDALSATQKSGRAGLLADITGITSAEGFKKLSQSFSDEPTQEKLADIANALEETVMQNNQLIQEAQEQNRIDSLMLQAAQQQRLLSAGTFSGDTGPNARNLFSRLATSTGAARGASAIRMSEFLNQIGLPETDESFQFERNVRSQSVRENIASVLSQRVGYRVRPEDVNIRMATSQLGGQYGDEALKSRVEEGLRALNFSPEQARQSLLSPEKLERSAAASGVLVLKSPLDAIKVATEGSTKILEELAALERQRVDIQERINTEVKLGEIESKINALQATGGAAGGRNQMEKLVVESARLTAQRDALTKRIENPAGYRVTAAATTTSVPGVGGAVVQTPMGPAVMMPPMVVGGGVKAGGGPAPQGTPSMLDTFKTGFGTGLESAVRGPFDTIEEALKNLSDVGARVGQSLESSLGNAFGDFVTGAQRGSDAFRSFVVSVLNDASRAFASKAVQGLLGMALQFLPSLFGAPAAVPGATAGSPFASGSSFLSNASVFSGPPGSAAGGYIKRAAGGIIPAEVMKGEFIYGPAAAKRIGTPALNALNTGTFQKRAMGGALVTGGSGYKDDVKMGLPEGSYVIRKAMVERYGAPFLSRMAAGGAAVSISSGSMDVPMTPTSVSINSAPPSMSMALPGAFSGRGFSMGGGTSSSTATPVNIAPVGTTGGGVSISTSINITDQRTSATTNVEGDGGLADKQLAATMARQMEQIALRTIENQTRVGGMLRIQSLRGST